MLKRELTGLTFSLDESKKRGMESSWTQIKMISSDWSRGGYSAETSVSVSVMEMSNIVGNTFFYYLHCFHLIRLLYFVLNSLCIFCFGCCCCCSCRFCHWRCYKAAVTATAVASVGAEHEAEFRLAFIAVADTAAASWTAVASADVAGEWPLGWRQICAFPP